jgi:hypothetical protein
VWREKKMSDIEVQDMMGKLPEGSCWGSWSVSDRACAKCVIMAPCSDATKKRQSGDAGVGPIKPAPSKEIVDDIPESDPLEYMLKLLAGKYDQSTKKKDGKTAHYFSEDGNIVVSVAIGTTGIIKVKSARSIGVVELESIDKVEKVIDMLT